MRPLPNRQYQRSRLAEEVKLQRPISPSRTQSSTKIRRTHDRVHPVLPMVPRKLNDVSDSLSRDTNVPTDVLTLRICNAFPSQTPPNFRISPLHSEIASWLTSLLRSLPESTQPLAKPTRTALALGPVGPDGARLRDWPTTSSSKTSPKSTGTSSSEHSRQRFDPDDFLRPTTNPSDHILFDPPSIMWHRPLWQGGAAIHDTPLPESLQEFYSVSTVDTPTPTRPNVPSAPSRPPSSSRSESKPVNRPPTPHSQT